MSVFDLDAAKVTVGIAREISPVPAEKVVKPEVIMLLPPVAKML